MRTMRHFTPALLLTATLAASVPAQSISNVTLLGRYNPGGTFSDVWGWRTPGGEEYALLCADTGLYIIDCDNPPNLRVRAFVAASASGWQPSPWRDVKSYDNYVYVVSEGGGGMQIIDLADPINPVLVQTWGTSLWASAHNIAIDLKAGVAYVTGTDKGTFLIDISAPANPSLLSVFTSGGFIHDVHAKQKKAFMVGLYSNDLTILDVSSPANPRVISTTPTPGSGSAHSVWASEDNALCLTANEVPGGPIAIYDTSMPRVPRLLSTISVGPPNATPHNVFWDNGRVHAAYYTEGYQLFDYTDPTQPVSVGHYDTFNGQSGGFNGAWGCYPFHKSGRIYISDIVSGLWIFKPTATPVKFGGDTPGATTEPQIEPRGSSYLGNDSYELRLTGAAASSRGALIIGTSKALQPFLGTELHVDPTGTASVVEFTTDAQGNATVPMPVANSKWYRGVKLYSQFLVLDSSVPGGLTATEGVEFQLFDK